MEITHDFNPHLRSRMQSDRYISWNTKGNFPNFKDDVMMIILLEMVQIPYYYLFPRMVVHGYVWALKIHKVPIGNHKKILEWLDPCEMQMLHAIIIDEILHLLSPRTALDDASILCPLSGLRMSYLRLEVGPAPIFKSGSTKGLKKWRQNTWHK